MHLEIADDLTSESESMKNTGSWGNPYVKDYVTLSDEKAFKQNA
jgi:hypothetical protein